MTPLPQTELTVDCEVAEEPSTSSSSSLNNGRLQQQQQQQLGTDDDAGDISPSQVPVTRSDAAATAHRATGRDGSVDDGGDRDGEDDVDGKTKSLLYTCARCHQDFSDETRYETHCKKCSDD